MVLTLVIKTATVIKFLSHFLQSNHHPGGCIMFRSDESIPNLTLVLYNFLVYDCNVIVSVSGCRSLRGKDNGFSIKLP